MNIRHNSFSAWLVLARASLVVVILVGILAALGAIVGRGVPDVLQSGAHIIHVNFAYVFWPLALMAALWSRHFAALGLRVSALGLVFSAAGALLAFFIAWAGAEKSLVSVLPLVRHPLHGAAIGLFLVGIWLALGAWLLSHRRRDGRRIDSLLWYPALPFVLIFLSAGGAWFSAHEMSDEARLSTTLWVALTQLPFLQGLLLLRGWFWLLDRDGRGDALSERWRHALMLFALLPSALVIPWQVMVGVDDPDFLSGFDLLVSWASWPAVGACGLALSVVLIRSWSSGGAAAARCAFLASFFLFALGAIAGFVGDESGTVYRSQLHWVSGALVIVYIVLLSGPGLPVAQSVISPPADDVSRLELLALFVGFLGIGGGIGFLGLSFFVSRLFGGANLSSFLPFGHWLLGIGVLAMLLGWGGGIRRAAKAQRLGETFGRWLADLRGRVALMDTRLRAVVATALAIGLIGGIIALLPPQIGMSAPEGVTGLFSENHDHVVGQMRGEVKERFDQGVVMLQARRYDEAATAFHRVLALAPEMPEAHVNMGFAMLGKEDYKLALDFFEGATELRVNQLNAYYGMALAYEGLGNIEAAAGAMKSYQHLTAPDDPFLPKVHAKLQQYEQQRGASSPRGGT